MSRRVSTRYAPHLALLLALATALTFLHRADRFVLDDCRDPSALLAMGRESRLAEPVRARFTREWGQGNWAHQVVTLPSLDAELETFVVRSLDPKSVYHRPEARVVHARPDRRSVQEVVEGNEILPVHRAHYPGELHSESGLAVVAYLLVYGGQPIANPYWSQLVSAPLQLVTGRRAMWLFLVSAEVRPKERRAAEAAALEWLGEAWHRYQTACSP